MNILRAPSDEQDDSSALSIVRQVDAMLAPMLVELHGEEVQPVEAADPTRVVSSYLVEDFGFHSRIGLALHDDCATALTAVICVGRFYRGYRKALRWLANNRASNTVSLAFDDDRARESELWLSCTRVTTPDDSVGLRAALRDIHNELGMVDAGLRMWFPQIVRGQMLVELEDIAQHDGDLRSLLASPQRFLEQLGSLESQVAPEFVREACRWLGHWAEELNHRDAEGHETGSDRKQFLWCRARPLLELRRYDELIEVCDELELLSDESDMPSIIGVRAHVLYEQGDFEEVLDVLRSATLDGGPRVCLLRSLAHARVGDGGNAIEAYMDYERLVGNDIIAARMLREVLPDQNSEFELA